MALTFPASPTNGQIFDSGTTRYTYSTVKGAWDAAPLGTALPFNYFVNPSMTNSQQNGTTAFHQAAGYSAGTTGSYYISDQWLATWKWTDTDLLVYSSMSSGVPIRGGKLSFQYWTYPP